MILLTRDGFRNNTLARLNGNCVVPSCHQKAVDAHHILNRNLFTAPNEEGGYFLENGAGLCPTHHLDAERTVIFTRDLYHWCDIKTPAIPINLNPQLEYDTWGNIINLDGTFTRGPLFYDEGCQRALRAAGILWKFGF